MILYLWGDIHDSAHVGGTFMTPCVHMRAYWGKWMHASVEGRADLGTMVEGAYRHKQCSPVKYVILVGLQLCDPVDPTAFQNHAKFLSAPWDRTGVRQCVTSKLVADCLSVSIHKCLPIYLFVCLSDCKCCRLGVCQSVQCRL